MAVNEISELLALAAEIRNEQTPSENTADRVGYLFEEIIRYLGSHSSSDGESPSVPTDLGALLNSLTGKSNPSGDDKILVWKNNNSTSPGGWGYISTPTGGGGGGVDWENPYSQGNSQIHSSHLTILNGYVSNDNILNNYSWWGRKLPSSTTNGVHAITGDMFNVGTITFTNGVKIVPDPDYDNTLKIETSSGNPAHLYATGGISALGNSSSGGGGETPTPGGAILKKLLSHINDYDYYGTSGTVNPEDGAVLVYDQGYWHASKLTEQEINWPVGTIASPDSVFVKKTTGGSTTYGWISASGIGGNTNINNLWGIGDVGTSAGYSSAIANNHVLKYSTTNSRWENVTLASLLESGDGISVNTNSNNQKTTIGLNTASTNTIGGIKVFGAGSSVTVEADTSTHKYYGVKLDANNKAYVDVPWTNIVYTGGNGITIDNNTISVDAGSGLTFANDKLVINDSYINGKWVTLDTNQEISGTKTFTVSQILANNRALKSKDTNGNELSILEFGDNNQLSIGWNTTTGTNTYDTTIYGNAIKLFSGNEQNGKKQAVTVLPSGAVEFLLATTGPEVEGTYTGAGPAAGLRIGDAVLYWDEQNQALALAKYNESQPNSPAAANFYATGGVSALGFSNGASSIGAMTFSNLTVTNALTVNNVLKLPTFVTTGSSSINIMRETTDYDSIILFAQQKQATINDDMWYYYNQYDNVGLYGTNYDYQPSWQIDPDGCAQFNRLYLDNSRYLYVSGGTLKYYNGSQHKTVAFD